MCLCVCLWTLLKCHENQQMKISLESICLDYLDYLFTFSLTHVCVHTTHAHQNVISLLYFPDRNNELCTLMESSDLHSRVFKNWCKWTIDCVVQFKSCSTFISSNINVSLLETEDIINGSILIFLTYCHNFLISPRTIRPILLTYILLKFHIWYFNSFFLLNYWHCSIFVVLF